MPSRKEYQMLFMLNAQLNGGFNSSVTKAQTQFAALGRELQSLTSLQSDVSSYQRQQNAIEATRAKLENLQKQHDSLQREIAETNGSTASQEREDLKLQQRIADTSASLERQEQRLSATSARLEEAGVDTSNLSAESAKLAEKIRDVKERQDEAAEGAKTFGEAGAEAMNAVHEALVASGIIDGLKAIYDGFTDCVSIAAEFEETMSSVEALSGASSGEMAALSEEAKRLGATTKFTANEAAEAMTYMGMAGWDAQEMLEGMNGVLQLAAASGEDLALTSDIVTDNLTAFGLTAQDTARFSDILAAAATNSNTNVAIMGETFKNAASIAGALNYSVEDVAVAVGLMANSGIKGSIAGTALKNTFNGLLEGATLAGHAFGEYEFSAVKADGTMKSFGETIDELRVYFGQMSEAEKVANAQAIAGNRAYNGLLAIINATDEDYASLTDKINNCTGAAQRMAEIKLDNLNGQLTLMQSAADAVRVTIGEEFNPELRDLAELATDALTIGNQFMQENPGIVKGIMTFVGVMGAAVTAVTAYSAAAKIAKAIDLGATMAAAGPILLGVAAVGALTAAVVGFNAAAKDSLGESWELTATSRQQYNELERLNAEYKNACEVYGETSYEAQSLQWQIEELNDEYENGKQTLEEYMAEHQALMDSYHQMVDSHSDATTGYNNEEQSVYALTEKLRQLTGAGADVTKNQDAILAIVNRLNAALPDLALSYDDVIAGTDAYIASINAQAKAQADANRMNEAYAEYVDRIGQQNVLKDAMEDAAEQARLAQEEFDAAEAAYNAAVQQSKGWDYTGLGTFLSTRDEQARLDAAREQLEQYRQAVDETTQAYNENEAALSGLEGTFSDYQDEQLTSGAAVQESINAICEQMTYLTEEYEKAYSTALDSINGQYALWDEAGETVPTKIGNINKALESQVTYWQDYNANLQSLSERTDDIDGLSEVIASFADGSEESVNAIAGMANASDEDLAAMVQNWKDLQAEQEAASGSIADLKTNFTEEMDQLQDALTEDIAGMNLSDDAAEAGRATLQGYISAANSMLPTVQAAYARVAAAANAALENGNRYGSTGTTTRGGGRRGYATGTPYASPGAHIVGEHGPEAIMFRGGEQVLDAARTATALGKGGGATFSFAINIQGDATPATADALRSAAENIKAQVLDAIEQQAVDAGRRSYR